MDLKQNIAELPDEYAPTMDGQQYFTFEVKGETLKFPVACHTATFIWTYWAAYDHRPTAAKVVDVNGSTFDKMLGVSALLTLMARDDTAVDLERSLTSKLTLTPGSLVVFLDDKKLAKHSCAAKDKYLIGGYNQVGWFSRDIGWLGGVKNWKGKQHSYTEHPVGEFVWNFKGTMAKGGGNAMYTVVAVPEATAVRILKEHVKE